MPAPPPVDSRPARRPDSTGARVALAYLAFVLVGVNASVGGVALPAQMADYGVNRATFGATFFVFSAGYLLGSLTTGPLVRHLGLRGAAVISTGVVLLACLSTGLRPSFALFVALALPCSYGIGVLESVLNVYLTTLPGAQVRLGRLHAFFGVGALLGPVLAARILRAASWPTIWLVQAAAAAPLVVAFAVLLHRDGEPTPSASTDAPPSTEAAASPPKAAAPPSTEVAAPPPKNAAPRPDDAGPSLLLGVLRQPAVLLAAVLLATYVGLEVSAGTWTYTFLVDGRGLGDLGASSMVSGYWLGLTLGRFVISPVTLRRGWSDLQTMSACLVAVLFAVLLVAAVPTTPVTAVGLVLVGFFLGPVFPSIMAATPRLADARHVPTAIGLLNGVAVLGGSALPWLAGVLIQDVAPWTLMPYCAGLAVVELLIWRVLVRGLRAKPPAAGASPSTKALPLAATVEPLGTAEQVASRQPAVSSGPAAPGLAAIPGCPTAPGDRPAP